MNMRLLAVDHLSSPITSVARTGCMNKAYMPYGRGSRPEMTALGFTGQLREPGLEIYLLGNGHRAYNSVLMRFMSADQLSPMGRGGVNSYAYCKGDPINFIDPSGRVLGLPSWAASFASALAGGYMAYKDSNSLRNNQTYSSGKLAEAAIGGTTAVYTGIAGVLQLYKEPLGDSMANDVAVLTAAVVLRKPIVSLMGNVVDWFKTGYNYVSNRYHSWRQGGRSEESVNSSSQGQNLSPDDGVRYRRSTSARSSRDGSPVSSPTSLNSGDPFSLDGIQVHVRTQNT